MGFTVKVVPRLTTKDPDYPDVPQSTVYDLRVIDGKGEGGEEYLVGSRQGYANRAFAVTMAYRLFATPAVWADHIGVAGGPFNPEPVQLVVYGADGAEDQRVALRAQ